MLQGSGTNTEQRQELAFDPIRCKDKHPMLVKTRGPAQLIGTLHVTKQHATPG